MEIQDWPAFSHRKKRSLSLSKSATIIVLSICTATVLTLTPIILLTSSGTWAASPAPGAVINARSIPGAIIHAKSIPGAMIHPTTIPGATPSPSPTSTPTPKPTPTPLPSPITPFPTTLVQQMAAMQEKDRFFLHGNTRLPEIALTFDDGPNPPYTTQVLAILRHYGVKATFFCVGTQVAMYPDLVKQEYTEGHMIGNHTWSHPNMSYLSIPSIIWQLTTAGDAIQHATGVRPTLFRPPYGAISSSVLAYANYFALTVIQWNVDPRDWSMPGVNIIYARVLAQTSAGSIILLHDGGGNRSETVAALPMIIEWFQKHNFQFVTIPRLIHDDRLVPDSHSTM